MEAQGSGRFVVGESDARLMRTAHSPGTGARVACNVQSAVDGEHSLVVHHAVIREGNDTRQLEPMAKAAQVVSRQERLSVAADAGYSDGEQFQACDDVGITAHVPPNRGVDDQGGDTPLFDRSAFTHDMANDQSTSARRTSG